MAWQDMQKTMKLLAALCEMGAGGGKGGGQQKGGGKGTGKTPPKKRLCVWADCAAAQKKQHTTGGGPGCHCCRRPFSSTPPLERLVEWAYLEKQKVRSHFGSRQISFERPIFILGKSNKSVAILAQAIWARECDAHMHLPTMAQTRGDGEPVHATGRQCEVYAPAQYVHLEDHQHHAGETHQQIVEFPSSQVVEDVNEIPEVTMRDIHQIVHILKIISQRRIQHRTMEQTVVVPVPMTVDEIVHVPTIQQQERTHHFHTEHIVDILSLTVKELPT